MKLSKKYYQKLVDDHSAKPNYLKNVFRSFLTGGLICLAGQGILELYKLCFEKEDAITMMFITVIFLAILATGLGLYDKLGQYAKAGSIIPITGFANSMASSAMEYRPEGFILGVGANTFKIAGSVIVFGVFLATITCLIRYGWMVLM